MLPVIQEILYKTEQLSYHFKATHRLAALNYCALNIQRCQHSILSSLCVAKPLHLPVNFAADNAASCVRLSSQIYQCTTKYSYHLKIAANAFAAVVCVCVYLCMPLIDFSHVMPHKVFHLTCCKPAPLLCRCCCFSFCKPLLLRMSVSGADNERARALRERLQSQLNYVRVHMCVCVCMRESDALHS